MFQFKTFMLLFYNFLLFIDDNKAQTIKRKFSCEGRISGYYADIESGCQVYHMCDGLGRQFSYSCPNATLFQQRMLICDHWYMVNCSKAENDYSANLLIGQKDKPFIGDYLRTPRPDLLSHPTASEYNVIYRTSKSFSGENLVGIESEPENNENKTVTDRPIYFLPSHWSTEFSKQSTTSKPFKTTSEPTKIPKTTTTTEFSINFKSAFKATTPQFPSTVDATTVAPDSLGILPPLPYQLNKTEEIIEKPLVNFQSKFEATTPVFPLTVESTSVDPGDAGVLPVKKIGEEQKSPLTPKLNEDFSKKPRLILDYFEPPKFDKNFLKERPENVQVEITPPSKFYQPPKFEPDFTSETNSNIDQWEDLKKKFLVPDYEFPLETVSRPSYDSILNSFQAQT